MKIENMKPDELIEALVSAGWSQAMIAKAVGVSQPTISRILSGKHKDPRHSIVEKLQRLFSLTRSGRNAARKLPNRTTL